MLRGWWEVKEAADSERRRREIGEEEGVERNGSVICDCFVFYLYFFFVCVCDIFSYKHICCLTILFAV